MILLIWMACQTRIQSMMPRRLARRIQRKSRSRKEINRKRVLKEKIPKGNRRTSFEVLVFSFIVDSRSSRTYFEFSCVSVAVHILSPKKARCVGLRYTSEQFMPNYVRYPGELIG